MKTQAKKAIALAGGAAILVLAVGFGGGDLSPNGATTTRSSSIALAFRSPPQVGQAHAGGPTCVTDSTNPCPPPVVDDSANAPSPLRTQTICRPAGKFGQHCYRRLVP